MISYYYITSNDIDNDNKQIFHSFLWNVRNYSPEVINIQLRKAELNIVLPWENNVDIEQKKVWNICFIICQQHQTRSGKIKANKTQQILVTRQVFFRKSWTTTYLATTSSKSFYISFKKFSVNKIIIHKKTNRIWIFLTWNWQLIRD